LHDVRRLIDTDLVGVIQLMQLFGRGMVEHGRASSLSIGSQTALPAAKTGPSRRPPKPPSRS
jgi:short-subunit dehydrogenase